ncbi:LLM class flavin-dependent oxidoreductase [Pseudactinotalea sp. HY160]|uniref:LLM class flavin-dependent oxidoreductase n=1 Tax=Pseudactinotalea sp. HY160 TaxID=2654490 RepID=UPI00351B5292
MSEFRGPLSILDLASVGRGERVADALAASVDLARTAERCGYHRVWYAEHHNNALIASAAPAVLIAHVAAHTATIRLGSGGVMLPNHAPLVIAEQFGTLAELHPGRIDLGLGRAPGTDRNAMLAMRRGPAAAQTFPRDVQELQGYLSGESLVEGIRATPGAGTNVPVYILGSSLFGARLAAALGLPYAFASHFAPAALTDAVAAYRAEFRPSPQCERPYVIAAANVLAADSEEAAAQQLLTLRRRWVTIVLGRTDPVPDAEADLVLDSPHGRLVHENLRYTAAGTPGRVADFLHGFAADTGADELILAHQGPSATERLHSVELTAAAMG